MLFAVFKSARMNMLLHGVKDTEFEIFTVTRRMLIDEIEMSNGRRNFECRTS